ncbi:hypothetical protein N7486_004050 [Penicillium sp. IBT 16267x]|nr:hypothetical protein N7486_004050 [Penicillium sp. IBT 16267x]
MFGDHLPILANATLPDAEWTRPYFEMSLPTDLPSRVTLPPPASGPAAVDKGPHTIHQLLLVLNYLFVSAMLPEEHNKEQDSKPSEVLPQSEGVVPQPNPSPEPLPQEATPKDALSTEPFQTVLEALADLERDDPKLAFQASRLVGIYRRL